MSLNCLSCQVFQRTNSDLERNHYGEGLLQTNVERSWSGNLVTHNNNKDVEIMKGGRMTTVSRKKLQVKSLLGQHRRHHFSSGSFDGVNKEPRLVRSCGMRRDWSFEDLSGRIEKKGRTI
uniref:Uncharacterized protein n=1 Tax=Cannabis sativa TaxID=3483 RepID=A0A803PNF7_CANSA